MTASGALLGAGVWLTLAILFGTAWALIGYRAKTRRKDDK